MIKYAYIYIYILSHIVYTKLKMNNMNKPIVFRVPDYTF